MTPKSRPQQVTPKIMLTWSAAFGFLKRIALKLCVHCTCFYPFFSQLFGSFPVINSWLFWQATSVNSTQLGHINLLECSDFSKIKGFTFPRKEFCLLILDLRLFFKNIAKPFSTMFSKDCRSRITRQNTL